MIMMAIGSFSVATFTLGASLESFAWAVHLSVMEHLLLLLIYRLDGALTAKPLVPPGYVSQTRSRRRNDTPDFASACELVRGCFGS